MGLNIRTMGKTKARILLVAADFILAVCCAWVADSAAYRFMMKPIYTTGAEAYNISGCSFVDGVLTIIGEDPQFVVDLPGYTANRIQIRFGEPTKQETALQVFYASPGEWFSEERSVKTVIGAGSKEAVVEVPKVPYAHMRFDFEQGVFLRRINVFDNEAASFQAEARLLRSALVFAEVFVPLLILILVKTRKKAGRAVHAEA